MPVRVRMRAGDRPDRPGRLSSSTRTARSARGFPHRRLGPLRRPAFSVAFGRPFYALEVPWALEGSTKRSDFDTKLYAGGDEATTWEERQRIARLSGGRDGLGRSRGVVRLLASVEWSDVVCVAKAARRRRDSQASPTAGSCSSRRASRGKARSWITRRQVDQIDRDEDFNLAPSMRGEAGISPACRTVQSAAGRLLANLSSGTSFPMGFALFTTLQASTRRSGGSRERRSVSADARGYVLKGPWTFVGRLGTIVGWRLDPENQIRSRRDDTACAGTGFMRSRGTAASSGNVEARVLARARDLVAPLLRPRRLRRRGCSWGDPDGFWRLADAGVGLRIGITRASKNNLVRIDVARVLHPDPLGRTGWLLSFASGQAF